MTMVTLCSKKAPVITDPDNNIIWHSSQPEFLKKFIGPSGEYNVIAFVGKVADDGIRKKYFGKSVAHLYEYGEANPVKLFLKDGGE